MTSEAIYQTLKKVFNQNSKHREVGLKTRVRLIFSTHLASRCFEIG